MCKVYKVSEKTDSKTNPYVFKNFNSSISEISQISSASFDVIEKHCEAVKKLEQKIESLQKQADMIIGEAKAEAAIIIETANDEAKAILKTSSIEGYKKGLSLANKNTEELIRNTNSKTLEIIENAKHNSEKIINALENDMLELSFDIARKILDIELDRSNELFAAIINKALLRFRTCTIAKIAMQAHDLKKFQSSGIDKLLTYGDQIHLEFVSDKNIKKGDIIIETDRGTIDAGINSQFTKIKNSITQERMSAI